MLIKQRTSKYDIGNQVWAMFQNKPSLVKVVGIIFIQSEMTFKKKKETLTQLDYRCEFNNQQDNVEESQCFDNKEALIKSLYDAPANANGKSLKKV